MIHLEKIVLTLHFLDPKFHQRLFKLFMQKAIRERTDQPIARSSYNN